MKRYLVRVEYSGFEKVWVEADSREEAIYRVTDTIDLEDVEMFCEKCYPVESYARKTKGEN